MRTIRNKTLLALALAALASCVAAAEPNHFGQQGGGSEGNSATHGAASFDNCAGRRCFDPGEDFPGAKGRHFDLDGGGFDHGGAGPGGQTLPVPEVNTYVMMLAGLCVVVLTAQRRPRR